MKWLRAGSGYQQRLLDASRQAPAAGVTEMILEPEVKILTALPCLKVRSTQVIAYRWPCWAAPGELKFFGGWAGA